MATTEEYDDKTGGLRPAPTGWIDDADGNPVVQYEACGSHRAEWVSEEAYRLALAAPELLQALKRLIRWVDPHATPGCDRNECDVEFAEEAIARAEVRP